MDQQERINHGTQVVILTQQVVDLLPKLKACSSWEQQAVDDAADLVFDVPSDSDQARSRHKNGPGPLAFFALDLHFSVPADPDQLGQSSGVILIALIQAGREYCMCVASIQRERRRIAEGVPMARKPKTNSRNGGPATGPVRSPKRPLEWWRTEHAEFFDASALAAMREALATVVIFGEPNWRAVATGDASAAIGLALRLNPQRSTANAFDLIMTALAACAADGSDGASLVLSHVMRKAPNSNSSHAAIATSWLMRCFARVESHHGSGDLS